MRPVLRISHAAVSDFQHVRIIPVSRPRVRLQSNLLIQNCKYTIRAAAAVFPLFLSSPAVLDIVGGAPQIAAHFLAPQPWLMLAPLANAEHNRPAAGIKRGPDIGVRGFRTLVIQRVAPVILQVIDPPRGVHNRILVLVPKAARALLASFRSRIGINSKL